ncbi:MAG TPA: bifunctional shikimate kinase/3-dehydroquinate synthase [Solirubrobacteraceae bacterium]|jgi:shikimate kinase/3-dehydroquinate synthase|nr:bifunctional shikimate kinase/3-dehydroquinate synthase [Solirubrobacteraceae bacterium]
MGAGKSRAATEVATALGVQALDSDKLLEERMGHSIAEEFERHGEAVFREQEEQVALELLATAGAGAVLALGGGSILSPRVRAALEPHLTVLLDVDAETAWERAQGKERPLARDRQAFAALYQERREIYEGLADAILPSADAAGRALGALLSLAAAPSSTHLLWASAASGEYPVLVGSGLLANGGWSQEVWPLDRSVSRSFCVSDETVAVLHGPPPDLMQALVKIPPGEQHKTLASAEHVWQMLAQQGMTRADHVVAFGGGVVGDLAGFCAATYQRGVPVVQVPTTLVAQVDSAYGGKTGVDLPEAKNYVGAYHQPAGVMVDPDMLLTLPTAERQAGWVEVLKTALIAGGELWRQIAADEPVQERTILACARTKLAVVAADERDGGRRQVLNLGHTVGHAIETVTGYARYRHGEAVGLGLLAALRLSGQQALREQVRELLLAHDLPVRLEGVEIEQVLEMTLRDKKRLGVAVPFVLVSAPGDVRSGCEVAQDELRAAVTELA